MFEINYDYLRPKKAAALKAWHEEPFPNRDDLKIWRGSNATILPLRTGDWDWAGYGGVVDSDGQCVELSETRPIVQLGYPFENPDHQDLKVVYCGYLINHWGHFLTEAVARLWYFLENDDTIDKYVFVLKENEVRQITGNFRKFFELLKIWDKIELISTPTTYREVIVPELSFRRRSHCSTKYTDIFDTVAQNIEISPDWIPLDKIYLSRGQLQASNKLEFGFEVLDDFFERNGYTILYPEKVPLEQMIYYIRHAKNIASVSGTPPHNILFGRNGQSITIMERCALNNDFQVGINRVRELHTTYVDANFPIYTVRMPGPFIMGYNEHVKRFAQDQGSMLPPAPCYRSEKYRKDCFVRYMKTYQDLYRYHWFTADYITPEMDYHYEGYQESMAYFGDYLNGSRPFLPEHYFMFHYWKQLVKRVLKKLGLYHE